MKKILLFLISILSIFLLSGCNKETKDLDKDFDDTVFNTLINYSISIYDKKQ